MPGIYLFSKPTVSSKHSWSNGRIIAFQAIGPGSTPGGCIHPSYD
jgi:hypothetical protein